MTRATGVSLKGSMMSLALEAVILGLLQQRRQQRGGVPIGQVESTLSRLPDNRISVRFTNRLGKGFTDDIEGEVNEGHHGEHDQEVLEEGDEGDGGGGEEDGEGDEEVSDREELEEEDVESVGMERTGSVVESVEEEESDEEREGRVDHHHGNSEHLVQPGGPKVVSLQGDIPTTVNDPWNIF